jgi:hypothetical protein
MARVMVGSTIPAYKAADDPAESQSWLVNAEALIQTSKEAGHEVWVFATLETDARGLEPFKSLLEALNAVAGSYWKFNIDLDDEQISGSTRLPRICAGRNLLQHRALMDLGTTHLLFLDSDVVVPADSINRLVALDHPLTGGHLPQYCLGGPVVRVPQHNIQEHWTSAGFLMATRDVIRQVGWSIDPDGGMTDDPHYAHVAERLGFGKTWVDHQLIGVHRPHKPGFLYPVERRGHNLKVYR